MFIFILWKGPCLWFSLFVVVWIVPELIKKKEKKEEKNNRYLYWFQQNKDELTFLELEFWLEGKKIKPSFVVLF